MWDYYLTKIPQNIYWETEISETDEMPIAYFFRNYDQMPKIEQTALGLVYGKTLDVGCGAGAHLAFLNAEGHQAIGVDVSEFAIKTCLARGFKNVKPVNLLNISEGFDTILLLMNGTGIFESIKKSTHYLGHLKKILNPHGQILIDSSDILYMYDKETDGSIRCPKLYYGELTFRVRNELRDWQEFSWLYLDFDTLKQLSEIVGLKAKKIVTGKHHDYLAKLSHF